MIPADQDEAVNLFEAQDPRQLLAPDGLDPLVRKVVLNVSLPSLRDNRGDVDRVLDLLEKQSGIQNPSVPFGMVPRVSEVLHDGRGRLTVTLAMKESGAELIDVMVGDEVASNFALAVDLGSTNLVLYLLDLHRGVVLEASAVENPQVAFGEDVLSRMHHCEKPGGQAELQKVLMDTINGALAVLLQKHSIEGRQVYAVAAAGNTAMVHLCCGFSTRRLCREPYSPVINRLQISPARALGLQVHERAVFYALPNVGSYAGGDALAGILVSQMHRAEKFSVLVDVGTNAEIVLGNRHWLMVAAGAAGPALEGGVVRCGMRAGPGAIDHVQIDRGSLRPTWSTIGGLPPKGICGSGLIDLMAELFLSGVIDERGKIDRVAENIMESDGHQAYRLVPAEQSGTGAPIVLTQFDLENLLRTKAAMYTALTVMTRQAGLSFGDLESFFVAGTFGSYIDPEKAVTLGMVPDIPLERYRTLHNSAGMGACLCLLSNEKRRELEEISRRVTYVELNVDGDFMPLLSAAMFLPHTDAAQFPSVRARR